MRPRRSTSDEAIRGGGRHSDSGARLDPMPQPCRRRRGRSGRPSSARPRRSRATTECVTLSSMTSPARFDPRPSGETERLRKENSRLKDDNESLRLSINAASAELERLRSQIALLKHRGGVQKLTDR